MNYSNRPSGKNMIVKRPDPTLTNSQQRRGSAPLDRLEESRWERLWPTFACGAGLFSDGYLNSFVPPGHQEILRS